MNIENVILDEPSGQGVNEPSIINPATNQDLLGEEGSGTTGQEKEKPKEEEEEEIGASEVLEDKKDEGEKTDGPETSNEGKGIDANLEEEETRCGLRPDDEENKEMEECPLATSTPSPPPTPQLDSMKKEFHKDDDDDGLKKPVTEVILSETIAETPQGSTR